MNPATRPASPLVDRSAVRPGFSPELFDRLWDIDDIAAFADVSERTAWALMKQPGAPARLRLTAKTVRWDPTAVVTFLLSRTTAPAPTTTGTGRPALSLLPDPDRVTVIAPQRRPAGPAPAGRPAPVSRRPRKAGRA